MKADGREGNAKSAATSSVKKNLGSVAENSRSAVA
jgi:hypothetical protein